MRALLTVLAGVVLLLWYFAMFEGVLWAFYVEIALATIAIPLWIRFERRGARIRRRRR